MSFPNDAHVEFGKSTQDKVLGTHDYAAHVSFQFIFCFFSNEIEFRFFSKFLVI